MYNIAASVDGELKSWLTKGQGSKGVKSTFDSCDGFCERRVCQDPDAGYHVMNLSRRAEKVFI